MAATRTRGSARNLRSSRGSSSKRILGASDGESSGTDNPPSKRARSHAAASNLAILEKLVQLLGESLAAANSGAEGTSKWAEELVDAFASLQVELEFYERQITSIVTGTWEESLQAHRADGFWIPDSDADDDLQEFKAHKKTALEKLKGNIDLLANCAAEVAGAVEQETLESALPNRYRKVDSVFSELGGLVNEWAKEEGKVDLCQMRKYDATIAEELKRISKEERLIVEEEEDKRILEFKTAIREKALLTYHERG
ncbi:hypothetical protein CC2G_007848 [Coprinopsis cinerea AmutBmut pab1-1]|nr:hypothetical protein CC2G_007848 [Coprinopsis cinerea AmutBmut pab1-1]